MKNVIMEVRNVKMEMRISKYDMSLLVRVVKGGPKHGNT